MVEASGQATDGERTIIFRARAWRSLETYRDVELLERQTLHDLHGAIQSAFELDDEHPYVFYLNNHAFDDRFDYLGPGIAASERQAETTRLETLRLKDNKRFLYVFDFGDELRHELQVVRRAERSPNASYPRQLGGEGDLPTQYPDLDVMDDPLAEDAVESEAADGCAHADVEVPPEVRQALEAMIPDIQRVAADYHRRTDAWRHGGEDALAEDELDAPLYADQLRRDHGAALQLLDAARDSLIAIHIVIEHAIDDRVVRWLQHLPDELSDAGLNAEAVELSERVLSAGGLPALRFPLFLARLGQGERALAAVEHKLAELPDDSEVLSVAGEVHQTLGEDEAAITYYQQALEWAGSQHWLRGDIVVALLRLYERTGQASAGVRLLQREQEREEELEQAMRRKWGLPSGPVVRAQPKVGRNEPCPCGSGKKHKKCCGKPA